MSDSADFYQVLCVFSPAKVKWNMFYKLFKALTSSDIA